MILFNYLQYKSQIFYIDYSMNSDLKLQYLQCSRGGYHSGQFLNTVCLNPTCSLNPLCCCACLEEFHNGHQTKTLKKLLIDAQNIAKNSQSHGKQSVKNTPQLINADIIYNIVQQNKNQTLQKFNHIKNSTEITLNQIKQSLQQYYDNLLNTLKSQNNKNPSKKIYQCIQNIQGSTNQKDITLQVQQILSELQKTNQKGVIQVKNMAQDSLIHLIEHSNRQVSESATQRLIQIRNQLTKSGDVIFESTLNVKDLWSKDVFNFSSQLKHPGVWIPGSYQAVSKNSGQYQVALMQPSLQNGSQIKAFKFKIKKSSSNWIAVGMCHQNIVKSKNFALNYAEIGHGCYLISSNGGTWSTLNEDLNNKVKVFTFKEGDTITCIVNRQMKEIFFVKDVPNSHIVQTGMRQVYELPYQEKNDALHPCAVFYYANDQIQYIPAINLQNIPRYDYLFSETMKHPNIRVINGRMAKAENQTGYRACLINRCLQDGYGAIKKFSFRIVRSSSDWIAVGMCHAKTTASNAYGFDYNSDFHGYYMTSSNGGSWSCIQKTKNNKVQSFKFIQGDVIECTVIFGSGPKDTQNKIIFKRGNQSYELRFQGRSDNKLYPCVMLHYAYDEVNVLPSF